jgi:outer membrane protein assembly factor BamD
VKGLRENLALLLAGSLVLAAPACAKRKERRAEEASFLAGPVLYRKAMEELSQRDLGKAKQYLERIQFTAEDLKALEPLVKLRLADTTFYRGDDISLIEARSKYLDFVTLHGDHPLAPYAQFQAGTCSLKQVSNPSRDQDQTRLAIGDLREVLRRYPASAYARAAQGAIDTAESLLAEHEFMVGKFYLKRKAYLAASQRFRRIVDRYPAYREKEKLYFHLGRALMLGEKNVEGRTYLDRLVSDYPHSEFAEEARKFLASFSAGGKASAAAPASRTEGTGGG